MFYDLGMFNFDEEQHRYVYEENWGSDGAPLEAWMIEMLFSTHELATPTLISEIRYAELKHDPKAVGNTMQQVVILGLSKSSDNDQMRSPDDLKSDEIKIELADGFKGTDFKFTLVEDLRESIALLSSLRLFVEQRTHQKAA